MDYADEYSIVDEPVAPLPARAPTYAGLQGSVRIYLSQGELAAARNLMANNPSVPWVFEQAWLARLEARAA